MKAGHIAALAIALALSPLGICQSSGGVTKGNTNINVNAENVNTIAVGSNNTARTSIGSVKGNAGGKSNITVDVKNVSNVVTGRNRKGCVNIGTKGTDPDCN